MALGSIFLLHSLHHRRWRRLGLLQLDSEMTQYRIIEFEAGFDFKQRLAIALDVQANIVRFRQLFDYVSQLAATPVFNPVNLAASGGDDSLVAFDHRGH